MLKGFRGHKRLSLFNLQ